METATVTKDKASFSMPGVMHTAILPFVTILLSPEERLTVIATQIVPKPNACLPLTSTKPSLWIEEMSLFVVNTFVNIWICQAYSTG